MGNNNFFDQSATFPFQYGLTFIGWGADELFEDWGADDLLLYEPFFGGGGVSIEERVYVFTILISNKQNIAILQWLKSLGIMSLNMFMVVGI